MSALQLPAQPPLSPDTLQGLRLARFARETDFYRGAWEELQPFIRGRLAQLILHHGFVEDSNRADWHNIRHNNDTLVQIPHTLGTDQPSEPDSSRDYHTVVTLSSVKVKILASAAEPLLDIICVLQCLLPGRFLLDKMAFEKGIPSVAWLAKHETMLRDTMGDSHFRHLWEAAGRG